MTERNDSLSDLAQAETIDCSSNPTEVTKLDEFTITKMGIERTSKNSKEKMDDTKANDRSMKGNHNHRFELIYHPEVASSDGRRRAWHIVGKSAMLEVERKPEGNNDQQHESGQKRKADEVGTKVDAQQVRKGQT